MKSTLCLQLRRILSNHRISASTSVMPAMPARIFSSRLPQCQKLGTPLNAIQSRNLSSCKNQPRCSDWILVKETRTIGFPSVTFLNRKKILPELKQGFISSSVRCQVIGRQDELLKGRAVSKVESRTPIAEPEVSIRRAQGERNVCPGCGIHMQDKDPNLPGFFKEPAAKILANDSDLEDANEEDEDEEWEEVEEIDMSSSGKGSSSVEGGKEKREGNDKESEFQTFYLDGRIVIDEEIDDVRRKDEAIGYEAVGPEYGEFDEEEDGGEALDKWNKLWELGVGTRSESNSAPEEKLVVCARCHALRNYGKVKDERAENLLPDFDFNRVVGARIRSAYGRRSVMVMLIDAADFDGSFPRQAAEILADASSAAADQWEADSQAGGNTPRLLVVVNKSDLLPTTVSMVRLEAWVRRRVRAGGAPRVSGVHFVSAHTRFGLTDLANKLGALAGPRGDVWVIGAQNAGKSSLINALGRLRGKPPKLTESSLPGTTIGLVTVDGIFPNRTRLLDTPGIIHPHQLTTRLTTEEQKLALPRKKLRPRTFRIKVGSAIHLGGLVRVDVVSAPSETIYLTVWASSLIPCHMGRVEAAGELLQKHITTRLVPPIGDEERVRQLGRWLPRSVQVAGTRWDQSSADVAIAGVGWIGVGVSGKCNLRVWTYEGVAVTTRDPMVLDMAKTFEQAGFSLGKDVPGALPVGGKANAYEKKKKGEKKKRSQTASS